MDQADLERLLRRHLRAQADAVPAARDRAGAALLERLAKAAGERRPPRPARLARPLLAAAALAACVAVALLLVPSRPAKAPVRPTTAPTAPAPSPEAGTEGAEVASATGGLTLAAGLSAGAAQPAAGPPGTRVLLRGTGCAAGAVRVLATRSADRPVAASAIGTIAATGDGAWSGGVQVPASAAHGPLWLWLECAGPPGPSARAGPLRFDVTTP